MSNSPAPGTPQTSTKAVVGAVVSGIVTFVGVWIADTDPFTAKEAAGAAITGLISSGLVGGLTYGVPNKSK